MDSAVFDWPGTVEHCWPIHCCGGCTDISSSSWLERLDACDCGAPSPLECSRGHCGIALLGMALGRHWTDPGNSHNGNRQGNLRSFRGLGTVGPLARRLARAGAWLIARASKRVDAGEIGTRYAIEPARSSNCIDRPSGAYRRGACPHYRVGLPRNFV